MVPSSQKSRLSPDLLHIKSSEQSSTGYFPECGEVHLMGLDRSYDVGKHLNLKGLCQTLNATLCIAMDGESVSFADLNDYCEKLHIMLVSLSPDKKLDASLYTVVNKVLCETYGYLLTALAIQCLCNSNLTNVTDNKFFSVIAFINRCFADRHNLPLKYMCDVMSVNGVLGLWDSRFDEFRDYLSKKDNIEFRDSDVVDLFSWLYDSRPTLCEILTDLYKSNDKQEFCIPHLHLLSQEVVTHGYRLVKYQFHILQYLHNNTGLIYKDSMGKNRILLTAFSDFFCKRMCQRDFILLTDTVFTIVDVINNIIHDVAIFIRSHHQPGVENIIDLRSVTRFIQYCFDYDQDNFMDENDLFDDPNVVSNSQMPEVWFTNLCIPLLEVKSSLLSSYMQISEQDKSSLGNLENRVISAIFIIRLAVLNVESMKTHWTAPLFGNIKTILSKESLATVYYRDGHNLLQCFNSDDIFCGVLGSNPAIMMNFLRNPQLVNLEHLPLLVK